MLQAAISSDIDTLASIYKGRGCRRKEGYTYAELHMGLENFSRFLEPYKIKATLFMVGNDFLNVRNHSIIRATADKGHEIANHTLTHAQGFRFLTPTQKESELAGMEMLCKQVAGQQPVGFRSPGWNISDDALPILQRRGYLYDSSVHPTILMPLLKLLHWCTMRSRKGGDRTTMGQLRYMLAPLTPYRTGEQSLAKKGQQGIIEFPVTVVPPIRLPFFATFTLATGFNIFKASYNILKSFNLPIQFQFHLSDFVDYNHPVLADQVPEPGNGIYVPQALYTPLSQKMTLFRRVLDTLATDYNFVTLAQWAQRLATPSDSQ